MCPIASSKRPLRGIGVAVGAMCPIRPERVWAPRLPVRPDDRREDAQALERDRRVHPGVPGHRRRPFHRRRRGRAPASTGWPPSGELRPTSASTTGPSSSPTPWRTGAASTAPTRCSSTRAHPWQNAWIESFNGRLRDEHLNGQLFETLLEAQVLLEDWRIDYNMNSPHSAHGWLTPAEFAEAWPTTTATARIASGSTTGVRSVLLQFTA